MSKGVVMVTGASRGIGAEIAVNAAMAGNDVVIGYVDPAKEHRAAAVAARVAAVGQRALVVRADITDRDATLSMLTKARYFAADGNKELTTLVLNAAGGLGKNNDEGHAYNVNAGAPWALASNFLITEKMAGNTKRYKTVVYVTSHPSHFYGNPHNVLPAEDYDIVAQTKHTGEDILRTDLGDQDFGIKHRLLVASADLVDGTAGATLLRLAYRTATGNRKADLLAERSAQLEELIGRGIANATEFGGAIVGLFMNDELPHGHTLYVPQPVLGDYVVPTAELPYGLGDPSMHTFLT